MRVTEGIVNGIAVMDKRLTTRERSEAEAVLRLRAEGALLVRLGGQVTPRVVAHGEDEHGPFVRMEKIELPTIAKRLEAAGGAPLETGWIERAFVAALRALAHLHEASDAAGPLGIVHADLSPANLAIDDAGLRAVLFDLELASWREAPPRDGAFRGTVTYTAPEIARGEPPTPQSDLFSLGAVFLHALTGELPRTGSTLAAVLAAAAESPLAHARHAALAARGAVHEAILACVAHHDAARPRSAREILTRLGTTC